MVLELGEDLCLACWTSSQWTDRQTETDRLSCVGRLGNEEEGKAYLQGKETFPEYSLYDFQCQ